MSQETEHAERTHECLGVIMTAPPSFIPEDEADDDVLPASQAKSKPSQAAAEVEEAARGLTAVPQHPPRAYKKVARRQQRRCREGGELD